MSFTTTASKKDDKTSGELKAKFTDKANRVTVTSTYTSSNTAKVETTMADAANVAGLELGSVVSFTPNTNTRGLELNLKYLRDRVAIKAVVQPISQPVLDIGITGQIQATTVGFQAEANTDKLVSYNIGVGFADKDYALNFFARNKLSVFVGQFYRKIAADLAVAAIATYDSSKGKGVKIEFGGEKKLDADSSYKLKFDNEFKAHASYTQKLRPGLSATVGSRANALNLGNAEVALGVEFNFTA